MAKSKNNSFGSLRKAPSIPRIRTSSQGNSQAPRDTSLRTATMGSGGENVPAQLWFIPLKGNDIHTTRIRVDESSTTCNIGRHSQRDWRRS